MFFRSINWVACHRNFSTWQVTPRNLLVDLSVELEKQRAKPESAARERGIAAAALRAFREEWKFRAATEPGVFLWESHGNLDWVVIHDPNPAFGRQSLAWDNSHQTNALGPRIGSVTHPTVYQHYRPIRGKS